jgi:hypothetical protein
VFDTRGYSKTNYFNGSQMEGLHSNDQMLPVGTYFYVIDYVNGTGVTINKAGYIYINSKLNNGHRKSPCPFKTSTK